MLRTPRATLAAGSAFYIGGAATGIRLSVKRSGSIRGNDIATSTEVGILPDADNAGVTVPGNRIAASRILDRRDDSHGTRTAGTADTWTSNQALRSAPVGICGR